MQIGDAANRGKVMAADSPPARKFQRAVASFEKDAALRYSWCRHALAHEEFLSVTGKNGSR